MNPVNQSIVKDNPFAQSFVGFYDGSQIPISLLGMIVQNRECNRNNLDS